MSCCILGWPFFFNLCLQPFMCPSGINDFPMTTIDHIKVRSFQAIWSFSSWDFFPIQFVAVLIFSLHAQFHFFILTWHGLLLYLLFCGLLVLSLPQKICYLEKCYLFYTKKRSFLLGCSIFLQMYLLGRIVCVGKI